VQVKRASNAFGYPCPLVDNANIHPVHNDFQADV